MMNLKKKRNRNKDFKIEIDEMKILKTEKITLDSITNYKRKKIKEWEERKDDFDLKKFVKEKYDIHCESQKQYINNILEKEDIQEFIYHYSKYQFVLKLNIRKEIQRKIKTNKKIMKEHMIYNNIIPDEWNSIKDILINILKQIRHMKINDKSIDVDLINIFKNNHVYFNSDFTFLIPTRFSGSYDFKFNKLLFDIAIFFFPYVNIFDKKNINDKQKIKQKSILFKNLNIFIDEIDLIEDNDELIDILDYLFNCLEIISQAIIVDYDLFKRIIFMCLPFKFEIARDELNKMKILETTGLRINNIELSEFDMKNFTNDSLITLERENNPKIIIKVKVNEINWYLGNNLMDLFEGDNYLLCFRYKSSLSKNYIKINQTIERNYIDLFNHILKSNIIKIAMMKDSEAKLFDYPFDNEDILTECQNIVNYVPYPVTGVYGFTDKYSFNIYINSNFSTKSLQNIFIEYDNIIKTQIHEYKHITRIYYHLFNHTITLSTPITNINNKSNEIKLIKDNYEEINNKIKKIESAYNKRKISYNMLSDLDYGDIFELSLIGNKSSKYFLCNSIFNLKKGTWNKTIDNFEKEYVDSINDKNVFITKDQRNPFITSIIEYFDIKSNFYYPNDIINKDTLKNNNEENNDGYYDNIYIDKETISHYNFPK